MYFTHVKILPVTSELFSRSSLNQKSALGNKYSTPQIAPIQDVFVRQTPSFEGFSSVINTQSAFREYAKNGHIGCVYCGKHMFTEKEIGAFLKFSNRLASNAKLFATAMLKNSDYFSKENIKLLEDIRRVGSANPDVDLREALNIMNPKAEYKLLNTQKYVFERLLDLKEKALPVKKFQAFDTLVQHSYYRIQGIPYVSEYSAKEFDYKVCKLVKTMNDERAAQQIMNIANFLTHPAFKEKEGPFPIKLIAKIKDFIPQNLKERKNAFISSKDKNARVKVQLLVLKRIKDISKQHRRPDIVELCDITEKKLLRKPVILQFSNKSFRYKLYEILEDVDPSLRDKFQKIAQQLPTSLNNKNAFIVKNKDAANETIIYNLLSNSRVTIEHIQPILRNTSQKQLKRMNKENNTKIKKGVDIIGNWALACPYCNNIHGSDDIKYAKFPFSKKAGERYFRTIIKDANDGQFNPVDVIKMAKNYFSQTGIKPDTRGLKYIPDVSDDIY